ncbi:hypothetical protein L198_05406 [Cryptococcus wingfieldii CBS 7118]|uniref:HAT C-terminal dimerisation domain-containing protein n=1 Tax=Cryptococcus wingfieldii CBS 7118 TaxID=1295528 RepID=A0A1E3J0Q3_9TREE|nr:hypothetical protein L198_05406 [Cryptococcus wingfieldii CBS 7118]ODN93541.1 hypothetical protein L198_05406 [Cryptococcus wingfieldii CBS 7118]
MATRVARRVDDVTGVVQKDKGTDKQQSIAQYTKAQYSKADCFEAALDCLIDLNLPIMTVDRPVFRHLMLVCGNGRLQDGDIYHRTKATSMIEDRADVAVEELKALLKKAHAKKSITWDLWTSADCTSFVAVTVHWVTNKFKITSDLLEFKELESAHTGSNLAELLYQLVKEYDIAKSLMVVTSDNASVNDKATREFANLLSVRDNVHYTEDRLRGRCFSHIIGVALGHMLVAMNALPSFEFSPLVDSHFFEPETFEDFFPFGQTQEEDTEVDAEELEAIWSALAEHGSEETENIERVDVGKLLAKIRQLIVKVRGSPNAGKYFEKCCVDADACQLVLLPFSKTRWGSMCTVIERVLVLRPAIDHFTSTADKARDVPKAGPKRQMYRDFTISDCEYQVLEMLRKIMRPGVDIQQIFGAQDHPSIGLVMIELSKLIETWERMSESFTNFSIQPAIQAGINSIKKYYKNAIIAGVPVFALFLHPAFKDIWSMVHLGAETHEELLQAFTEEARWTRSLESRDCTFRRYRKIYATTSTTSSPATPTIDTDLPAMSASQMKMHKLKMERKRRAEELARSEAGDPELTELTDYFKLLEEEPVVPKGVQRHEFVSEWILTWWYKKQTIYPVLSKMARDIWGVQASSVPCKRMFSQAGLADTKRRQSMTPKHSGQLQRLQAHAKVVKEVATKRSA